ncbi:pseudouridine synthase [Paludicola sp. MB14-C6]|uniref:pseudouridine synthase n=1 Tax=Paludihabitans sp. MB14-C6 TaxID=3070656 RepID=UPI0027DE5D1F|nr:pseudouridine synthase [Paludicola sp. MB14-C6]WMJ23615.1 pseudouridine synthase [Paludicola sp. MB14-C6]
MPTMRLDKFFSSQEILSRKEVKAEVKKGTIKVNDTIPSSPEYKMDTDKDIVTYKGKEIPYKPYVYIMLNKPQGVVSATDDKINKTVLDLVPKELFRSDLFPAGRLDKDTVGFVLITNDGDFAHNILSPKNHIEKKYLVRLDKSITEEEIQQVEQGITLADGTVCRPASIQVIEAGETPLLEIVISEGKYHQIKRMFGVVNCGVTYLKRTQMGGLRLDEDLPEGICREIMHNELHKILLK